MPTPGPGLLPWARRVAIRRAQTDLRKADLDLRPDPPRPGTVHPMRPVHAILGRDLGRSTDRVQGPRQPRRGQHVPGRAIRLLLFRQHRPAVPGWGAHRHAVPVQGEAVGSRRHRVHFLRRLHPSQNLAAIEHGRNRSDLRCRQRRNQPRVAVGQGPFHLRTRAVIRTDHRAPDQGGGRLSGGELGGGHRRRRQPARRVPW